MAYALIIAMARLNGDRKYPSYWECRGLKKPVEILLKASGVDLSNSGGFVELRRFQEHLSDYKISVFDVFNADRVMLVEIPYRPRNFIYCMIGTLGTIV